MPTSESPKLNLKRKRNCEIPEDLPILTPGMDASTFLEFLTAAATTADKRFTVRLTENEEEEVQHRFQDE
ncbi:MAG TPA: hypothetical protein VLH19_05625 [Patescibacteria group bacterium]|nr:hypothetical protein [Patescibacteria group bacterium]